MQAPARLALRRMGALGAQSSHPLGLWPRHPVRCADGALISAFLASIERSASEQMRQAARRFGARRSYRRSRRSIGIDHRRTGVRISWAASTADPRMGVLGMRSDSASDGLGIGGTAAHGAIGRRTGGALGGFFYQSLTTTFLKPSDGAIAIIILGALIGFFIGLVGELLKRGWLMWCAARAGNAREAASIANQGRDYYRPRRGKRHRIVRRQSVLGSHAIIRREGKNFIISRPAPEFVNRQPGRAAMR